MDIQLLKDIATLCAFPVIGYVLWLVGYRNKARVDSVENDRYTKQLAVTLDKAREDLAQKLIESDFLKAERVQKKVEELVKAKVDIIQVDSNHKVEMLYAALKNMTTVIQGIARDVITNEENRKDAMAKLERSNYLISQVQWGRDTKSESPLTLEEPESEEHKQEEEKGIFKPTEEEAAERAEGDTSTQESN